MGYSSDIALRCPSRLEEDGVPRFHGTSTAELNELDDSHIGIRPTGSEQCKTEEEIVTTAKLLFRNINDT